MNSLPQTSADSTRIQHMNVKLNTFKRANNPCEGLNLFDIRRRVSVASRFIFMNSRQWAIYYFITNLSVLNIDIYWFGWNK